MTFVLSVSLVIFICTLHDEFLLYGGWFDETFGAFILKFFPRNEIIVLFQWNPAILYTDMRLACMQVRQKRLIQRFRP